ncbi:Ldh family oxidoreductase [Reichenbachiella sp. MALMAid0571]|uniref:Ldh family oxidoreductase n=1 Tax=Reichenbachiella sp. MALMAid0571 TaxID=3143939 RepID=UPI0032DE9E90
MIKFQHKNLIRFATSLLTRAGLPEDRAKITASTLVESDLMGHSTHGLSLLSPYLDSATKGKMKLSGDPRTIRDTGASIAWDGQYLPGPWLIHEAIDLALERITKHPVVTMTIQKSHHIGCLAAYPERATEKGLMMLLSCSDPINATVAPFGGLEGVYSPNPLAIGFPTEGKPVIIDISMSSTANGLINQSYAQGKKLPHPWLQDGKGEVTDDPASFMENPPATILPLGGQDAGYKGFGLGLLIEMLTSGLGGHGRADSPTDWGASVFLQVFDPEGFGGLENFKRQAQFLAEASLASKPIDPGNPVRLPGHRAMNLRDKQKKEGVVLNPSIVQSLESWGEKLGVVMPENKQS